MLHPNANFYAVTLTTNGSTSDYDALQVQFQRNLKHGLQLLASYSWAHSIDTSSAGSANGNTANTLSVNNPDTNRGSSDFDVRNAATAAISYDIPVPHFDPISKQILGGWSLETLFQARTAPPVNVTDENFYQLSSQLGTEINVRPDLVPGASVYLYGSKYPGGKALNPVAFMDPPTSGGQPTRQGNVSRNSFRGFSMSQWDFAVHREFPIYEKVKLQFRSEMFNVVNHPNFGQPYGLWNLANFGLSTQMLGQYLAGTSGSSGGQSPQFAIGGPRSIQMALKLVF
jgi:hypothetical protein